MPLEGLHHITAITADAQRSVDFHVGVLGLQLVKRTVNFDQPDVYHLYFGDARGAPGSILTFFEFPGAAPGEPGAGMVHTILWRVAAEPALDHWEQRLADRGLAPTRTASGLTFADPEGLRHELVAADVPDAPLIAPADDIPVEHALRGFHGIRAYTRDPASSASLLQALGFELRPGEPALLAGAERRAILAYDVAPAALGRQGAGTVHHIAWSAADDAELAAFAQRARETGAAPTPLVDRQYFHSVYFREPSGVLFELASRDIGFELDEPIDALGRELRLPPQYADRRAALEQQLTPLVDPRRDGSPTPR